MAGKKGAKKTVGKARKGDTPKFVMRLHYVQKPNGALAPRYERVNITAAAAEAEPAAQ